MKSTVLIVDDVPGNIKSLVAILGDSYALLIAKNGQKALEIVASRPVDLILLDVMMPGMDGYEVCRRLKSNAFSQDVPVIFVTAKNEIEDETHALELGAVDFLAKPVSPPVVRARVRTHLGLKLARETLEKQRQLLEKQNQELREAAELREDVDRIMRHDLKSPLNSIIGFSDMLRVGLSLDEEQKNMLQTVIDAGYRLLGMINLSLDMYKMETGVYQFQPDYVDLVDLINKISATLVGQFIARQTTCQIVVDGRPVRQNEKFFVLAEELLCYSMLNNLLTNAFDASPKKAPVTVFLKSGHPAVIEIHNYGAVPEQIRDRFFDKFVTVGKDHGTGLGTYSARLMVETQNGSIAFKTSESDGTTLSIAIPSER
ncbi:MAG: hybrid sensor histidine kinase/response regulator [Magnetococcales bacterium]|nr:hybrid sensor histidine kinase/response regulator [Magnetococcales bacterium]